MASLSQSSWFTCLHDISTIRSRKAKRAPQPPSILPTNPKSSSFKSLERSSFALGSLSDEFSPPNSSDNPEVREEPKSDRVKLAFERAKEYKKSLKFDQLGDISEDPVGESPDIVSASGGFVSDSEDGGLKEVFEAGNDRRNEESDNLSGDGDGEKAVPEAVRIEMMKAKEYQKNKGTMGTSNVDDICLPVDVDSEKEVPAAVRIAMEKAKEHKENKGNVSDNGRNEGGDQLPGGVKEDIPEALRIAMEKAQEYKKSKGTLDDYNSSAESLKFSGGNAGSLGDGSTERKTGKSEELKISSIDFVGLNFADKKQGRGLPAGLIPVSDPFPEGDLPEVEILVGDASNFGNTMPSETKTSSEDESADLYKPTVSTWGMFPRPSNISKTFGGGRNIRPGEALETPEQKAAKEARTRQLLAAYKSKIGLNIDPKLKAECEKALKDGDSLMDVGRLKEALPYYQEVMDKLSFQTELHGLAALQWSICQDSLSRPEKAQVMYEKLQSHPNAQVNKKARQFMFSFQAMEMMKVTRSTIYPRNTGYQKYFEAFVDDKESYTSVDEAENEDGALVQALPYIVFLASPILVVLLVAASKGT